MTFARKTIGIALAATVLMPLSAHAATAEAGPSKAVVLSNAEFARLYGAKALTKPIGAAVSPLRSRTATTSESVTAHAWHTNKFNSRDVHGREIPTRWGNSKLGWNHFSGPHNIHNEKVVKAAYNEHPEAGKGYRKEFGAVVLNNGHTVAKIRVISWWHWQTKDGRYKLPGHKGKIGTITAFCQGVNRCPDVVNTV
ncbi:hypothetical protein [Streptomyces decoyicus]|uniref:hypothetical protein n=1 Tax=Streptomyces decoyicus TaxID=249567 RepID=UPI0038635158